MAGCEWGQASSIESSILCPRFWTAWWWTRGPWGREEKLWLFVVLDEAAALDEDLAARIRLLLKTRLSPRHSPDEIRQISAIPITLSGKKLEVPIRRILTGTPLQEAVNPGTLANPEALDSLISIVKGSA